MTMLDRINSIKESINSAEKKSCRDAGSVQLMAVSKTRSREEVIQAIECGLTLFGENRVLEAVDKFTDLDSVNIELIGHLQSNKTNKAVSFFDSIQSVDSLKIARKISAKAESLGIIQNILIEQNCSKESSKSGFSDSDELFKNIETIRELPCLNIKGLMTIAPFVDSEREIRSSFSLLRENFLKLKKVEGLINMDTLSMGMSGDFSYAIEEGSTLVRVGRAIFGERYYV